MDALHLVFFIAHMLGVIGILVGAIGTWAKNAPAFFYTLLWSARLQVLTGVVLAVMAFMDDDESPNAIKLTVKLLVALVVAGLAEMSARRERRTPQMMAITALTLVNAAVASAWH